MYLPYNFLCTWVVTVQQLPLLLRVGLTVGAGKIRIGLYNM